MFFLIAIKSSGQKKIVPMKWVKGLNLSQLLNDGVIIHKKKQLLVYISSNIAEEPDFSLEVFEALQHGKPGLYKAFILKCFDTYESAMNYFNKFYNNNEHTGAFDLDDDDIDRIQAILDGSDDDGDDDVEFLSIGAQMPQPKKAAQKE